MSEEPAAARVMVLDDDEDARECLSEAIVLAGAERCGSAGTVNDFLVRDQEVLASNLVVLDINLGSGQPSGLDAFAWLRGRGYAGRIVFLTGHARSHPLVRRACELPGVQVLEKPVGIDELVRLVKGS